ncbi:YktB family protein [Brevibacillus fluminis]|uniref:YktB family protein n=1 Tax=Brevibacillus fluminis TaxID=511487 RepID=UPI003F889D0D
MSTFTGFSQEAFDVFTIDGLDARMEKIVSVIRPSFEQLGQHFAPSLSALTGEEMFTHIAKHARRTVNPPKDTWVAFAADKRGYKKHPHFQIGLWGTHLFVWYAVIYESPFKEQIAERLEAEIDQIMQLIPNDFHWSPDHTQPASTPQAVLGKDGVLALIKRLKQVKKAELLCGLTIPHDDSILADGERLLKKLDETMAILARLYNMGKTGIHV